MQNMKCLAKQLSDVGAKDIFSMKKSRADTAIKKSRFNISENQFDNIILQLTTCIQYQFMHSSLKVMFPDSTRQLVVPQVRSLQSLIHI